MKILRVYYVSRINLLSGRTNVYNTAKTCEALCAQNSLDVRLVTTDQNRDIQGFFKKMGIAKPFNITCLGVTNSLSKNMGAKGYELLIFIYSNIRMAIFLITQIKNYDVIYYRDDLLFPAVFFARVLLGKKVFFETHSVLSGKNRQILNISAAKFSEGIIVISSGLKRYYGKYNDNDLLSLCSAAEDSWFEYSRDKLTLRKELNLPEGAYIAGYTGVVGSNPNNDYYELDDIVKSLANLPKEIIFVIVGELNGNAGWLRDIAAEFGVLDRVTIVPWQERSEIPKYLQSFDINLIPKRKKDLVGDSPAKMFPALAARRPIIGGRTECILEVLTNGLDAVIVGENSQEGWAEAITKMYGDPQLAQRISKEAENTNRKYTWEGRGKAISDFMQNTLSKK